MDGEVGIATTSWGSPLWSHASPQCPTARRPEESHIQASDGQPRRERFAGHL